MNESQRRAYFAKVGRTRYDPKFMSEQSKIEMNMRTLQDEGYEGRLGNHLLGMKDYNNYLHNEIKREKK